MMQLDDVEDNDIQPSMPPPSLVEGLTFHPEFSLPDANVVIAANEAKMYFRVHSYTLKTTSGFFKTMFSLPQSETNADILYLDEDSHTLEHLLRMISGLPFPEIESHDTLDALLSAAEKYDMPGPLSLLRMYLLRNPSPLEDLIRLYAVATRFGWVQEAKVLSERTLVMNLHDDEHTPSLRTLSTDALLALFKLHHQRKVGLKDCLNSPPFVSGNPQHCVQCDSMITYTTWKELKIRIILEMDERPLGDTVINEGLCSWAEAIACWRAACGNETCKRLLYDRSETVRVIKECIDGLPKTV